MLACHTVSILTGRKKMLFSHLCSSVIPWNQICYRSAGQVGGLHTKFEENYSRHFRGTSDQNFVRFSSYSSFRTLCKICHKTRMRTPIGLKFGTLKGLTTVDLITKFGRNLTNIHGVMADCSHKKRLKVCHAHRVNPLKE